MERNVAVIVLQDILTNFTGKWIDSFVVSESSASDTAIGYKLRIKGTIDQLSKQKIERIAQIYHLSVKEENGLVIYEPKASVIANYALQELS